MKRAFWPGFSWRVLAHQRAKKGNATIEDYRGQVEMRSDQFDGPVEFDELVIDDWLHLEQMGDRDWWIGLGHCDDGPYEYMINVHIDRNGKATIGIEAQTREADRSMAEAPARQADAKSSSSSEANC